jgi:hypothetical protein
MKVIALAFLVVLFLAIAPALFLWSVNSLAAAGGADFYIPHGIWTYLYSWVFLGLVASSARASSK